MINSKKTIPALCPVCVQKIPKFQIFYDTLKIKCSCGYEKEMPLAEYIEQYKNNKTRFYTYATLCSPHMKPYTYYCSYCHFHYCDQCKKLHEERHKDDPEKIVKLSDVPSIQKAEEHLNYLSSLRAKFPNNEKIEEAYNKCIKVNKNVLYFAHFLLDNYGNDHFDILTILKDVINFNTHKVFDENESTVLKYLNSFGFASLKPVIEYRENNERVTKIILLQDGRIAATSYDKTIKIYDLTKKQSDLTIVNETEDSASYYFIGQLDNGNLVSTPNETLMSVHSITKDSAKLELEIKKPFDSNINDFAVLSDNRVATCLYQIQIWNFAAPYTESSKAPMKVFEIHKETICRMKYLREKEILISGDTDGTITVMNTKNYEIQSMFGDLKLKFPYFSLYDNERVTICGNEYQIHLLNLTTGKVEKILDIEKNGLHPGGYCKLRDGKTLLSISGGWDANKFGMFRFDEDFLSEFVVDPNGINDLIVIDDETIISCSKGFEGIIKVWKY